jgi:hypothetical protein
MPSIYLSFSPLLLPTGLWFRIFEVNVYPETELTIAHACTHAYPAVSEMYFFNRKDIKEKINTFYCILF